VSVQTVSADVVVVGAGPIGLTLTNLLGAYGIDTILVERRASTVSEPRAVSIDDESLRAMQAAKIADIVYGQTMPDYGSRYISPSGKAFAFIHPTTREFGYPRRNAFRQDVLESQLHDGLGRFSCVRDFFEHNVTDVRQDDRLVQLTAVGPDGTEKQLSCRYLAACDGAASFIRDSHGIILDGDSYGERWLILDLIDTKDAYRHTQVYCDPARPGINLPGPHGTRRFEFMLKSGESDEDVLAESNVRNLLRTHGPDENAKLRRKAVYAFHARMAPRWQIGRINLLGDAAHITPPFAGQGMNSGLRDAHNFGWKIAAVVKGQLGPGLLDTYQGERKPHARSLIDMAVRMGYVMMPRTRWAALRMRMFFRLLRLVPPAYDYFAQMKYKPSPRFLNGFFVSDKNSHKTTVVGRMFPQPRVALPDNSVVLLDEVLGDGFSLISFTSDPQKTLGAMPNDLMGKMPVKSLCILPADQIFPNTGSFDYVRDIDGGIEEALKKTATGSVLLRPDRYVAAVIPLGRESDVITEIRRLIAATWRREKSNATEGVAGVSESNT
jgi:3-(3-hydroxy-phenyl)propionate hydroxylase